MYSTCCPYDLPLQIAQHHLPSSKAAVTMIRHPTIDRRPRIFETHEIQDIIASYCSSGAHQSRKPRIIPFPEFRSHRAWSSAISFSDLCVYSLVGMLPRGQKTAWKPSRRQASPIIDFTKSIFCLQVPSSPTRISVRAMIEL